MEGSRSDKILIFNFLRPCHVLIWEKESLFLQRGLVSNLRRRLKRIQGSSEVVSSTVAFKALRTDGKLYIWINLKYLHFCTSFVFCQTNLPQILVSKDTGGICGTLASFRLCPTKEIISIPIPIFLHTRMNK